MRVLFAGKIPPESWRISGEATPKKIAQRNWEQSPSSTDEITQRIQPVFVIKVRKNPALIGEPLGSTA